MSSVCLCIMMSLRAVQRRADISLSASHIIVLQVDIAGQFTAVGKRKKQ